MQYVDWADLQANPDAFFYDSNAMNLFKDHMRAMANRRNTINGTCGRVRHISHLTSKPASQSSSMQTMLIALLCKRHTEP